MRKRRMQVTDHLFELGFVGHNKVYSFEYILCDCIFFPRCQNETQVVGRRELSVAMHEKSCIESRHLLIEKLFSSFS